MKRPNILLIHTDQQRFDTIAANGNFIIKTPNLDKLASSGVNFTTCISQNPVCMPSRISLMTGQYCSALGITQMAAEVPQETMTIQKILKRYGYYNALIGKLHYLPHANRDHRELHPAYDFDHMELSDEPGCYDDAYRAWVKKKDPSQLDDISLGLPPAAEVWHKVMGVHDTIKHPQRELEVPYPFAGRSDCTHTAFVGEQTMEFLKQQQNHHEPFFCFSGFYSPHSPLVAPKEYFDLYCEEDMPLPQFSDEVDKKRNEHYFSDSEIRKATVGYYAMISEVDHWIGKIVDALDELGMMTNTIIAFTSDHGEWLGEHLKYGKGFWAPDVISRVPLIIKVPKSLNGFSNKQCNEIVECVDIVPTLLELAGIPIAPHIQGDILPVADNIFPVKTDKSGLTENYGFKSLRIEGYRYVIQSNGSELLFDLSNDPYEYYNVALDKKYINILGTCRKKLLVKLLNIEQPVKRDYTY